MQDFSSLWMPDLLLWVCFLFFFFSFLFKLNLVNWFVFIAYGLGLAPYRRHSGKCWATQHFLHHPPQSVRPCLLLHKPWQGRLPSEALFQLIALRIPISGASLMLCAGPCYPGPASPLLVTQPKSYLLQKALLVLPGLGAASCLWTIITVLHVPLI